MQNSTQQIEEKKIDPNIIDIFDPKKPSPLWAQTKCNAPCPRSYCGGSCQLIFLKHGGEHVCNTCGHTWPL